LRVSADDWFAARLNGAALGAGEDWHAGRQFEDLAHLLRPGTNILAIVAENKPANVPANPAGLIACLEIQFAGGEIFKLASDATWRWAKSEVSGWDTAGFDDDAWAKALVVGRYGDAPWGQIGLPNDESYGPQATGIPGVVRVIYVPESQPIVVRRLGQHTAYAATYFDLVSGAKTAVRTVQPDAASLWQCPPPAGIDHDWVLILESPRSKIGRSGE
jgi:hypothetical protein